MMILLLLMRMRPCGKFDTHILKWERKKKRQERKIYIYGWMFIFIFFVQIINA